MNHIAIIGAGQLGSRHLQGLTRLDRPMTLYVVDPLQSSLDRAVSRYNEMPTNPRIAGVVTARDIGELEVPLDLAIVASTADTRLDIMSRLLDGPGTRAFLLEKVLFSRPAEYGAAAELLGRNGTPAWVNLPRRLYDVYEQLRAFVADAPSLSMSVTGGGWGLGCNGVHFADLYRFLSGATVEDFSPAWLDREPVPSKRPGFVEFSGTLRGTSARGQLLLTDTPATPSRHLVSIRAGSRSALIDETANRAWLLDEEQGWREVSFTLPFQSGLTGIVAQEILETGTCRLPTYDESAAVHLPFVTTLLDHFNAATGSAVDACPIT